jgi:predicted TPR repeat methyltransferase
MKNQQQKSSIRRPRLPAGHEPAKELGIADALKLAMAVHRANGLDDAEKIYGRILAARPDQPDALHFMGVLQHQRGRTEDALRLIRRSIALDATMPDWHNNLGNVLLERGEIDAAADAYEQAVRLAPARADIQNNLGVLRREQGRTEEAESTYRRAIELNPKNVEAHTNLGRLLNSLGREEESMRCFCEALLLKPGHAPAREALGLAYYTLGRFEEAAQVYRDWLKDEPGNPAARHHLAACSGEGVPERAADDYVETVFDGFADSFDAKLAHLHYRAPELIAQTVAELLGAPQGELAVLDAGCGTGLCGPLLAPYARRLEGVDLSERMLARARARQVYDALAKAELTAFIEGAAPACYDLVISADTLCYFGDLRAVTKATARALRPGGWLVFTVEALDALQDVKKAGFHLHHHGRYSHRESYLREVLADAGLAVGAVAAAHLRIEGGKPVDGWIVSAQACEAAASHSS